MLSVAESSGIMPDIGIDNSLMKYSGLNSAAELEQSVRQVLRDVGTKIPDYMESLGSALTAFKVVPSAVGLGALAFAIVLEFTIRALQVTEREDSPLDMMRRVFAEEKASGVRDTMEEYMKRLGMYLKQQARALEETERLEKQLSEQLTRLKNSMLHDKQMSSRSMKHWTNGAAFHLQMLIHAARLKMQTKHEEQLETHVASIISVLNRYQHDLQELIRHYKTYKKSTILVFQPSSYNPWVISGYDWRVKDKELEKETHTVYYPNEVLGSSDAYIEYMFNNWCLLKELDGYFSNLRDNAKELIIQNVEFNIQNVLPASHN